MGNDSEKDKKKILTHMRRKSLIVTQAAFMLLFTGGCGMIEDDFFSYAPQNHVITKESESSIYLDEGSVTAALPAAESVPQGAEVLAENVDPLAEAQEKAPEDRLVGNVEYDESMEAGIIRDIPFVYKGIRMTYDGNADGELAIAEPPVQGRVVQSTVERPETAVHTEVNANTDGQQAQIEPPGNFGTVGHNGKFYEGRMQYNGDFRADIKIVYSEAGPFDPTAFAGLTVPVEYTQPAYDDDDDDDDEDWTPPAQVAIPLCSSTTGPGGRVYAVVRNREGGLAMMQYSYDYRNGRGESCHLRVIASFFGGASVEQAAALLDRMNFKYVGENTDAY